MSVEIETCVIKKIYPSIKELSTIQNNIICTEDGCNKIFKTRSNFSMHLQKHHKKQNLEKCDCIRQFYCPDVSCDYNKKIYFNKIKYLKQHYLKVHAIKNYMCTKCNKGFSTENVLLNHKNICGVSFTCSDCTYSYGSYEALMTHARRKNHTIMNKSAFFTLTQSDKNSNINKNTLLPKSTNTVQTINIIPVVVHIKSETVRIDKEVQTDANIVKSKCKSPTKRKSTQQQQTQTKKSRISAQTQTVGDCILKRAIQEAKINVKENKNNRRKCMETQTKNWMKQENISENFPDKRSEINFNFLDNENIMHTSSQTSFNNLNIFEDSSFGNCNSQTQTDVIFQDEFLQSTVFTSHIETQTNDEQSLDLCSNMYTQTCNDPLLSELEFTNIQTQTNWPDYDMFVSTETQTLLTHNTKSVLDMAINGRHMETQTDMEFKQLLEEINA